MVVQQMSIFYLTYVHEVNIAFIEIITAIISPSFLIQQDFNRGKVAIFGPYDLPMEVSDWLPYWIITIYKWSCEFGLVGIESGHFLSLFLTYRKCGWRG